MRKLTRPVSLALLALAMIVVAAPTGAGADASGTSKVIDISVHRFAFSPDHITLKKDEPVVLRVTSQDVTHGFFLRAFHIDELVTPGKPIEVSVRPDKTGTFTAICHHFCGAGHGNMKFEITVTD